MKRKKPKTKSIDTWRDVTIRLPSSFVRSLSSVRDKNGNVYPLPVARGNAIMNRLAYALEVAEGLAKKVSIREEQLARAMILLEKFESRLKENGVNYDDLLEEQKVSDNRRSEEAENSRRDKSGDDIQD